MLAMPAAHPLLGRTVCRIGGCPATAHGTKAGGCATSAPPGCSGQDGAGRRSARHRSCRRCRPGPAGCLVPGCQRMSPGGRQGQRTGLCQAHSRRFRRTPGMTMERFLADPRVRPLPPLGPCQVAACSRRSESEHGYCPTHYVRWRATVTAAPALTSGTGSSTCPAVSEAGQVSLRGLAPLVVLQVLTGIQHRVQVHGAKITDVNLRAVCDSLRRQQAASAETADSARSPANPPGHCCGRSPAMPAGRWPTPAVSSSTTPGTWRSSAIPEDCRSPRSASRGCGRPPNGWAAEDLPRHRGGGAGNVRQKINAVARLSESLRCRDDRARKTGALGRADIETRS